MLPYEKHRQAIVELLSWESPVIGCSLKKTTAWVDCQQLSRSHQELTQPITTNELLRGGRKITIGRSYRYSVLRSISPPKARPHSKGWAVFRQTSNLRARYRSHVQKKHFVPQQTSTSLPASNLEINPCIDRSRGFAGKIFF